MSNSTLYRDDMIFEVAKDCKQTKTLIKDVIKFYTKYIYKKTDEGKTIKFLQLFYVENKDCKEYHDTFAYICTEIAKELKTTSQTVQSILQSYQNCLLDELQKGRPVSIYGVAKVSKKEGALRIRKTGRLANKNYRVKSTTWFRKTVNEEKYDRENT